MAPEALAQVLGGLKIPRNPNLLTGFDGAEDAGVLRIAPDRALVLTTDFFPPMVDGASDFGRIAAANALSDVYAMGGRPLAALNILAVPGDLDPAQVGEILQGAADKVTEAGAVVAGGHTVVDPNELKFGLAVTGEVHPDRFVRNRGLRAGDTVLLTKPLGSGLIGSSIKASRNEGPEVAEAIRWMSTLNGLGLDAILAAEPHAMTDVTGFGFLGHLSEMLADDPLDVRVNASAVPLLRGVERCFRKEYRTRGARSNRVYVGAALTTPTPLDPWLEELLFDPQTSGGLLIAVPTARASALAAQLAAVGLTFVRAVATVSEAASRRITVIP